MGWHSGDESGGEEGIRATHNGQRQILHADPDEAVFANDLHVNFHVSEEDVQTHEGEESAKHQNAEERRVPNVER